MRISLKNIIVPTIPLAVLLVGFSFALWVFSYFVVQNSNPTDGFTVLDKIVSLFFAGKFLPTLICIAFSLLNAFLLAQVNNRFTIIRTRTFLPLFLFLTLTGSWGETHRLIGAHISLTLFILALFNLLDMVKNTKASEQAFMGSLFIGLASTLINPLILVIPVCWIGFIMFQSFSLRTFLATIFGVAVPWVFVFTAQYLLTQNTDIVQLANSVFSIQFGIFPFTLTQLVYSLLLFIIMIIGIAGIFSSSNKDAIQTRNKLNFLILLFFSIVLLSVFTKNHFLSLLPIVALLFSMLISHPFSLKNNNFYGIVFIVFLVLNIAYAISKYFIFQ